MSRAGAPDPAYVRARGVLLDALDALETQCDAIVLVGAQAIYWHTGDGDLAVAPYTTDGDLVIQPAALHPAPRIAEALERRGFTAGDQPGQWIGRGGVVVDLMVPESLGGGGTRGARLGGHGNRAARKARGLEAAVVDYVSVQLTALEAEDSRRLVVRVAGPAALLVAKLHKIAERVGQAGREDDKDALDVLRLLRHFPGDRIAADLQRLIADEIAGPRTREAMQHLEDLFSDATSPGSRMAARATELLEDSETIARSCAVLAQDVLAACRPSA